MKKIVLFIVLIASLSLQAQTTHTVINTNDSGLGSLRAAADSCVAGDTIRFSPSLIVNGSDSIVLTTGEIDFDSNGVVIKGVYTSTDTLFISGNNNSRIFSFDGADRIILDSLVLINGNGTGNSGSGNGGAIYSLNCTDTLFVTNSKISGNTASNGNGGGISSISNYYYRSSVVVIINSSILGNTTNGKGGGVYSFAYSLSFNSYSVSYVIVKKSIISGNIANGDGGGVYSFARFTSSSSSFVTVLNSTISGNVANNGGGICSETEDSSPSAITITNSTISGNIANDNGGGVYSASLFSSVTTSTSSISVLNSTIYGNSASVGGGVYSYSASIYSLLIMSMVSITNSTIYGNTANSTGGIYSYSGSLSNPSASIITVTGSIIVENGNNSSGIFNSHISTIFSNGYNIFSDTPMGVIGSDSTNIIVSQLNLQALAFNGGTTQTLLPGPGSIAIDNGNPNDNSNAQNAPIVGTRDIGATEACFALPSSIYVTECNSYTIPSGNYTYAQSGIYKDTLLTACGADSVITIHLSSSSQSTDVILACNSYTWIDGVTYYSNNNTAIDTLLSSSGCDSIVTLDLTIIQSSSGVEVVTACDSYTRNGITYTSSNNTALDTLVNAVGCDSIVTLDLTINTTQYTTDVISVCSSYTWIDGITYYSNNNTAIDTLLSSNGCDSIVTLDLTILQSSSGVEVVTACDSYTWNGITYTTSNTTALDTLINAVGCDSIVTLNLMINNTQYITDVVSACDSYTWIDGITYTSNNNTAVDTLVSSSGCDSIVKLDLTILNSTSFTDVIASCNPIVWIDGVTYNQTTNGPTYTLINSQGCDSVVTLDFTLLDVDTSVIQNYLTLTAQATNASYQWIICSSGPIAGATDASFTAIANGNYQVEVSQNGCVDTSACFSITNVSVQEAELIGVNLYPNPTSDVLHIDKGSHQSVEITITNSAGAIVYQSTSKKQITSIDMSKMAPGIYVVTLKNELGIKVEKVVKR